MSVDFLAVQRAIRAWTVAGSGLSAAQVYWGQQDSARVVEPAIAMRLFSLDTVGSAWTDTEANYVTLPTITVTSVAADQLTAVGHGSVTGDGAYFASPGSGALPSPLAISTPYWVIRIDDDTLQLAATFIETGGESGVAPPSSFPVVPIHLTDAGTTPFTLVSTGKSVKANQELRQISRAIERLVVDLECHTSDAVGMNAAVAILARVKARQQLPSQMAILHAVHVGLTQVDRIRAVHGVRNAVMFEPRAIMEVTLSLPTEEFEYEQRIERAVVRKFASVVHT